MRVDDLPTIPPLKTELIPPEGCERVGFHDDGRVIYERDIYDPEETQRNKVQAVELGTEELDANGKIKPGTGIPMFRRAITTGESMYPVWRLIPMYRRQRFILQRDGNGKVSMQEGFERSAEEIEHARKVDARVAFAGDMADEATRRGLSAKELIGAILGEFSEQPAGDDVVTDQTLVDETQAILDERDDDVIDTSGHDPAAGAAGAGNPDFTPPMAHIPQRLGEIDTETKFGDARAAGEPEPERSASPESGGREETGAPEFVADPEKDESDA